MGYVAFEAATLLDGHPVPDPSSAPVPPIALLVVDRAVVFDHWKQRLMLVAHVPAGRYDEGVAAVHEFGGSHPARDAARAGADAGGRVRRRR